MIGDILILNTILNSMQIGIQIGPVYLIWQIIHVKPFISYRSRITLTNLFFAFLLRFGLILLSPEKIVFVSKWETLISSKNTEQSFTGEREVEAMLLLNI